MRKLFILSSLFVSSAFSAPYPDEIAVCYVFSGDTLQEKDICVLSSGYGAGGEYTSLDFNGKNYLIEGVDNQNGEREFTLNDEPVIEQYFRDTGFYARIYSNDPETKSMSCTRSASLDICYYLND